MIHKKPFVLKFLLCIILLATFKVQSSELYRSKDYKFKIIQIIDGLNHPWAMVFLANNAYLISERNTNLVYLENGKKTFITIPDNIFRSGQGGVLDLALHPNYKKNSWIYITYAKAKTNKAKKGATALARFRLKNKKIVDWQQLYVTSKWSKNSIHFGSRIVFDKDNNVYFSSGDRGNRHQAQSLTSDLGKVLRLTENGSIIKNNLYKAIYSYGHRNIQGMYIYKNKILAHEHGPQGGDELNTIEKGKNYGWPIITYGKEYFTGSSIGIGTFHKGMQQPITYWTPSIAPSGLSVYEGDIFSKWQGDILIGALKDKMLVRIKLDENNNILEKENLLKGIARIRAVYVKNSKIFLLTDSYNGKILVVDKF